ncbi:MAG: cytochrome c biogenesis protein CcdA [Dehalococcoidia bacterium]|nr:cytochrome c biogenesis protein CcdA [Dehalococcoidia bacterium]
MTPAAPTSGRRRWLGRGYPRSFVIGATFSIAWSPCIGPILGVVLTLAATSGTAYQGALLLFSYSLGLGVWFLAMGAFFGWLSPRLRRLNPHLEKLMIASGVLFIIVGVLMLLGEFERIATYFQRFGFFFDSTAQTEQDLATGLEGWLGPAIAFFGGVVSFLSPCVLPLVPAYLVNIAGEAVLGTTEGSRAARVRVMGNAAAFVIGFTVVFTIVGASAGLAGSLITGQLDLLTKIGGVILIVFGLQMTGLVRIPYLDRTFQIG